MHALCVHLSGSSGADICMNTQARVRELTGKVDFLRGGLPIAVTLVLLEKSGDHRPQGIGMQGQQSPLVVEKS